MFQNNRFDFIVKERGKRMRKIGKGLALTIVALMMTFMVQSMKEVSASADEFSLQEAAIKFDRLTDNQEKIVFDKLKDVIEKRYVEYNFFDYEIDVVNVDIGSNKVILDVDVYADMVPNDVCVYEAGEYLTVFSYRMVFDFSNNLEADVIEIYIRKKITSDNELLYKLDESIVMNELESSTLSESDISPLYVVPPFETYYDSKYAIAYAKAHVTDEPDFNADKGNGSDCANFVSKCLNYGGIPEDKGGLWYYDKNGKKNLNWIRAGHDFSGGENGVVYGVPWYMEEKGFFRFASSSDVIPGSIIFWDDASSHTSHVALVTSVGIDGTIKYLEHSDYTMPSSAENTLSKEEIEDTEHVKFLISTDKEKE